MWVSKSNRHNTVLLILLIAGCGGTGDRGTSSPRSPGQQTTNCGGVSCQAGQYCADDRFGRCENGCLSDGNCADNQFCDKTQHPDPFDDNVGSCENEEATRMMPPSTDELARCKQACTILTGCSAISAADAVECNNGCTTASEAQRKAVADCVGEWDCGGGIPACTNIECGPAYPCGAGENCVGGTCL